MVRHAGHRRLRLLLHIESAGGKRKLLPYLLPHVPAAVRLYAEPFVGGGALFFAIHERCREAVLVDANKELIVFYRVLRDKPKELMAAARRWVYSEAAYYTVRGQDPNKMREVERAARFLYLNKTCFNGLWRVNKAGAFNVPFGRYTNPTIVDEEGLMACSKALQRADLVHGDFSVVGVRGKATPDFVYCDPPYDVLTDTADFTSYTKDGFGWPDQVRLQEWAAGLTHKAKVVLSNADTSRIRKLYKGNGWKLQVVEAARAINSNAAKRGKVKELVISQ